MSTKGQGTRRVDQEEVSDDICGIRGQVGGQRDPGVSGRAENGGKHHREGLGGQAVTDDLHIALGLGNDLRCGAKPDRKRVADQLYTQGKQQAEYGRAHQSLCGDLAGSGFISGADSVGDQVRKAYA